MEEFVVHSYFDDSGMPSSFQFAHTSPLHLKKTVQLKILYATRFYYLKKKNSVVNPFKVEGFGVDKSFPIGNGSNFCIINTALKCREILFSYVSKMYMVGQNKP